MLRRPPCVVGHYGVLAIPRRLLALGSRSLASSPSLEYRERVKTGKLKSDPHQESVVAKLDDLAQKLKGWDARLHVQPAATHAPRRSMFGWSSEEKPAAAAPLTGPRGLYLHGGTGTGKTMLMDLFFDTVDVREKRRVSFNAFMLDVHARVASTKERVKGRSLVLGPGQDIIGHVAEGLVRDAWLLCFDEFQVTDIGNAMIMLNLFTQMFNRGAVVVATSNRHPRELYLGGIQRQSFVPFIDVLQRRCEVIELDTGKDYRKHMSHLDKHEAFDPSEVYYTPTSEKSSAFLRRHYVLNATGVDPGAALPSTLPGRRVTVPVRMGRTLDIPLGLNGVSFFDFADLCDQAVFAADYMGICEHFHTVVMKDLPVLMATQRNQARRFITLIDELYEHKVKFICSADAPPHELFQGEVKRMQGSGGAEAYVEDEAFAFQRTISRLIEMQSVEYLAAHDKSPRSKLSYY